mgnify:FL=1
MNWWLIPVGFLSGICASMGIGGGFVLMLYLTLFADFAQKDAQFFNLLFFLPVAALSLFQHQKGGLIDGNAAKGAVWPGLTGAGIGALGAVWLSNEWISRLFALLILIVGIKELFGKKESG